MMDLDDILARCRRGDELAWEALVRRYQARVYGIACGYLHDQDEARDVAQEVFVRVYRNLDQCRESASFLAWLVRIARNACLDHLRRLKARPPRHDLPAEEAVHLADAAPNPEELWAADARKQLVYRAMGKLSKASCEVLLLKDIQGMSLEEIAGMLQIPVGTVKSRSNRARIELAQAVRAMGEPPAAGPLI